VPDGLAAASNRAHGRAVWAAPAAVSDAHDPGASGNRACIETHEGVHLLPMTLVCLRVAAVVAVAVVVSAGTVYAASVASASTGGSTLPGLHIRLTAPPPSRKAKTQTCQAGSRQRAATAARTALVGDTHKAAVVACEEPPRSELLVPLPLKHAMTNALADDG